MLLESAITLPSQVFTCQCLVMVRFIYCPAALQEDVDPALCKLTSRLPVRDASQLQRRRDGSSKAHRQKVPVWPVVSTPAKNSAAISGNILRSLSRWPVFGSLALSSRSAKLPRAGCVALMWLSSPRTMFCSAAHASAHSNAGTCMPSSLRTVFSSPAHAKPLSNVGT